MKRLLALLALLPLSAVAAPTCSISSPGLNFGSTAFIGPAGLSAQAPIDTTCDSAGLPATIGFADAGGALQVAGESVVTNAQGAGMSFRLYQDPARTIPWGRDQGKGLTTTLPFHGAVYGSITCAGVGCTGPKPPRAGVYVDNVQISARLDTGETTVITVPITATITPACEVAATDLQFPNADNLSAASGFTGAKAQTTLSLRCNNDMNATVELDAQPMVRAGTAITYGLYQDAALSLPWGTAANNQAMTFLAAFGTQQLTVYGLIPPQPNVPAGAYVGPVVATVTF